jgi:hypothetical protein
MKKRWGILVVLFIARSAMGFQYQSVATVSSLLMSALKIGFAQLGTLIGLYQLPGIFLTFPGGLLGKRFGDKQVVGTTIRVFGSNTAYTWAIVTAEAAPTLRNPLFFLQ